MAANSASAYTRRCDMCNYSTNRLGNYIRHTQSDAHLNLVHFHANEDLQAPLDCCSGELEETEEDDTDTRQAQAGFSDTPVDVEFTQPPLHHNDSDQNENHQHQRQQGDWFPFSSRADFYLYVLVNSTTHPVSDAVVKFVIFILKQCGVDGIPSFASIKRKSFGSFDWNDFLMQGNDNDGTPMWAVRPSAVAKLSVAHPDVSRSLIRHPRVGSQGECSHPAFAEKWLNDIEFFSATKDNNTYYKDQLCTFALNGCQQTGRIVTFVENMKEQVTEAVVSTVLPLLQNPPNSLASSKKAFLITDVKKNVSLENMKHRSINEDESFYKKENANSLIGPINHEDFTMNSNIRKPIVTVPVNLFFDDTSTHRSKRWLALHCVQMQLAGIPMDERHKEKNIHFIGASEKVDMMKLVEMAISDIRQCQRDGFITFDAVHQKECLIKCPLDVIVADYNVLSFCCNHLGASAIKYCPRCHASSETFHQILQQRLPEETKRTVNRIDLRSKEVDKIKLRKQTGVKEHFNCLWDVIDPHRDIPVGLLHLIPLGLAKHLIVFIISQMDNETLKRMGCHLETLLPSKGLEFFQYIESRQGKDFKSYLQVAPFNLLFVGADKVFIRLTCCLAQIQKQLNQENIDEKLMNELQGNITEYHQLITEYLPNFAKKAKTHLLLHVMDDIKRHGPPTSYDEDSFDENHGRIRDQIFIQNQKARSRDTAERYAQHILCSHIVTGGFFKDSEIWTQASDNICQAGCNPAVMSFLGIKHGSQKTPGEISKIERHPNGHVKKNPVTDDSLLMMSVGLSENTCTSFSKGQCVTSQSLDLINSGDWVEYTNSSGESCYGVFKGAVEIDGVFTFARVQKSQDLREEDSSLGCALHLLTTAYEYIPAKNIKTPCPFIHDCFKGKCRVSFSLTKQRVEQQNVSKRKLIILHNVHHKIYMLNKFHL